MATLLKIYVIAVSVITVVGLIYVYVMPPQSMLIDQEGIDHFTPSVIHAETGEPVALGELVRHFRGD